MKRQLLILGAGLTGLIILGMLAMYIWIDIDVKRNINTAKAMYPGTAEEALIAYLSDTTNTPRDRTRVAIYSLGQIQSQKAIPILEGLYRDDPEGKTCYGRHDTVLCQSGIYKALKACKSDGWPMHARLNK